MRLTGYGFELVLPDGWSGRVSARAGGGTTVHAGSFRLPEADGEFGDAGTGLMPPGGAFVALTEYRVDHRLAAGQGLFAARRLPSPLDPLTFSPRRLAHPRPRQLGAQHFATVAGRPLCLYVVLAEPRGAGRRAAGAHPLFAAVNGLLRSLVVPEIGPASA